MTDEREAPGLYVHLPFCSSLCPYCDFYVLTGEVEHRNQYLRYLLKEIELCAAGPWPGFVDHPPTQAFDTIYLGGGTPSLLPPEDLRTLLQALCDDLPVVGNPWIGLEANPEDVTESNLNAWLELGVRFLSLGVQSFSSQALEFLGRVHDPRDCRNSVNRARRSGLETLSIDLIYGLPEQTTDDWRADLDAALESSPDHLSCYQLTIEPGTSFGYRQQRNQLTEIAPDRQAELFLLTHEILARKGLAAYEISNFATDPGHRSRHNRKYWGHVPYLGLGPSAHSFADNQRWWNVRKIRPYEARIDKGSRPIESSESLTSAQIQLERLMLGLRTTEGVCFDELQDRTGTEIWDANRHLIDDLAARGLVTIDQRRLIPTLAGLAVAQALARQFDLPEA